MPMRRYRQSDLDGHPFFVLITIGVILYVFAGFFVYWLITGSEKVGYGGRISSIGELVWMGPLFAWGVVLLIGRRGPFARLWLDPIIVSTSHDRLSWTHGDNVGGADWDAIATIRRSLVEFFRSQRYAVVAAADGSTIAKLPMWLTDMEQPGRRRRRVSVIDVALVARPDRFRIENGALRQVSKTS
jgi:hypothetical protein